MPLGLSAPQTRTGEVSSPFPVVWVCSCVYAVPAEQGNAGRGSKCAQRSHESFRLLNIEPNNGSKESFLFPPPPPSSLYCSCKKRILTITLRLGSRPSSALIHVLLLHCDPWSGFDCKSQEVVHALGALRLCWPPRSDSHPSMLANRYDFMAAVPSSFKLLKGPYVLADCCSPRNKR